MVDKGFRPVVLDGSGRIDPGSVDAYMAAGGYGALQRVVSELTPEEVVTRVGSVGLLGRGGAGYPVARKWRAAIDAGARHRFDDYRFVIANAYDADLLSPIGRTLLEQMPHRILEGVLVAAYAIGAKEGVIYCRGDSKAAIQFARAAISQAEAKGFIGPNALGPGRPFVLRVALGWAGFVGGEETAAIAAIEGRRAMPVQRPPYPTERGLLGRPTVVHSAETLAILPSIMVVDNNGGDTGMVNTKVLSVQGSVRKRGLVEVPMGTTISQLVDLAGGSKLGSGRSKAAQIGGPTGVCVPATAFDVALSFESLREIGANMGSGRIEIIDDSRCMVSFARDTMAYLTDEACGRCVPCRLGTKRMAGILEMITSGLGEERDLDTLEEISENVSTASICGYGAAAPSVVTSTLRHFRSEYITHIEEKRCPTGQCKPSREFRYRRRAVL